jgi:hypothetical protein
MIICIDPKRYYVSMPSETQINQVEKCPTTYQNACLGLALNCEIIILVFQIHFNNKKKKKNIL